jgi:Ca2+-binding EF-hand superfamily protein
MRFAPRLVGVCLGFAGLVLVATGLQAGDKSGKEGKDPAGTSTIMGQLRELFARWDTNSDGFLDRAELAKAFRGSGARPAPSGAGSVNKANLSHYPDLEFLVQVDQNNDGKISRAEFIDWARGFASEYKKIKSGRQSASQAQKKAQSGSSTASANNNLVKAELQQQQLAVKAMEQQLKFLQTIEKQLKPAKTKKKA